MDPILKEYNLSYSNNSIETEYKISIYFDYLYSFHRM